MKRKIQITACFIFILFCFNSVFAKKVEIKLAEQVALNFYLERFNAINHSGLKTVSISERYTVKDNSENVYYIFNIGNNGFIIVSADDVVYPILGYSFESTYSEQNQPPQFIYWMDTYKQQISNAIKSKLSSTAEIDSEWFRLKVKADEFSPEKETKAVTPLLFSTWDQGDCYNDLCPLDAASSTGNGRVWAGCVATAIAQVMYYYRYPLQGQGSHSYTPWSGNYGTLSANFGTATYDWNAMTNSCAGTNNAIATLLYHCGVSVNMDYGPDGSSANTSDAVNTLPNYFKYSSNIQDVYKNFYSTSDWENLIRTELDNKRPVLYSGFDPSPPYSGHAFVCDGYQGTNYFHFNWGWSGYYNGYFYLSSLNPGGNDLSSGQEAVIGIYPGSGYPYNCTGTKTLTSLVGSFEDGSGPSNYQNNSDCGWLIAPACVVHINLFFDDFSTEAVNDVMTIYDGSNASAPVLATVSGTNFPSSVSSTGPTMFIKFTTNGSNTSSGWQVSYTTTFPTYCGITTLNAASNTFTDGSGNCNYNNSAVCQWRLEPTNAGSVTLHFIDFNTEPVNDFVKIVDPVTSTVLATYSGPNIPASVTSNSGKMLIYFV
ncbi:MAG: C10 family peptidase, partial [Bacteroidales bacterium]